MDKRLFAVYSLVLLNLLLTTPGAKCSDSSPEPCDYLMNNNEGSYNCDDSNNHGSRCTFQCRRSGFSICQGSPASLTCDNGNWNNRARPSCCDTEEPSLRCPSPLTKYAGLNATSALVSWDVPQVSDNSGEFIQPRLTSAKSSGSWFSEGTHTIRYEASDSSNNKETCSFTITIIVSKCNTLTAAYPQSMSCNNGFIYGSTCSFTCETGWCIDGNSAITCVNTGTSSNPNVNWNVEKPTCKAIDTDPPIFPNGPERVVVCAEERSFQAEVDYNWEPVMSIDVVSGAITARLVSIDSVPISSTDARPSSFHQGAHELLYEAVDHAGNVGELTMELAVEVVRCDPMNSAGNVAISCSHNNVLGSICSFNCPSGHCLVGTTSAVCENVGTCTLPISGWSEGQPSCQLVQCPELPSPTNGHFVNGSCTTNYGDECEIACNAGYLLHSGSTHRLCLAPMGSGCTDGYWSGQHPMCKDLSPPVLPPLEEISLLAVIRETYAILDYNWEPVFAIDDVSGEIEAKLVSIDSQPTNVNLRPTTLDEGLHTLEYEAEDEAGNKASRIMQLTIRVSRCQTFKPGLYENISCSHQNVYGSICTFTCATGECIFGSNTVTCDNTGSASAPRGEWNDTAAMCQPVLCPEFIPPTNGYVITGSCHSTYGSTCEVMCNPGYTLFQSGEHPLPIKCIALEGVGCNGGHWRGSVICADMEPPIFEKPDNLVETVTAEPGDTRIFVDYSWEPIIAFDTASGRMVASLISIDSQPLEDGERPDEFTEGSHTLVYEAEDNSGNKASWSMQLLVIVQRCPNPEPIENGQITCDSEDHILGSSCVFICDNGYCHEDNNVVTCLKSSESHVGVWSDENPLCLPHQCPNLLPPANGYVVSGSSQCSTSQGPLCEMACDAGYRAVGDVVRVCQIQINATCDDAIWSGQLLRCEVVACPSLIEQFPAFHTGCNKAPSTDIFGSSCQWHCPPGYHGMGPDVSTCLSDGTWDNNNFACADVENPRFIECPEGRSVYTLRNTLTAYVDTPVAVDNSGDEPTVRCDIEEGPKSEGVHNFNCSAIDKAGNEAICNANITVRVRRCQPSVPELPSHGNVDTQYPCDNHYGGECRIMCDEDYELRGNSKALCEYDADLDHTYWTWIENPICQRTPASCNPDIDHLLTSGALVSCTNMTNIGSVCTFYCTRQGYVIKGIDSPLLCQTDGTWNVDVHLLELRCEAMQCNPLRDLLMSDVRVNCTDMNNVGSVCTFNCLYQGYEITGVDSSLICKADGSWNVNITQLQPHCEDILPPSIYQCPNEAVYGELSPDTLQAEVHFTIPQANDNSQQTPGLETTPVNITSPHYFNESTLVTYRFFDNAGNDVTCSFQVIIQNNLPPKPRNCPQALQFDSPGEVAWQIPQFSNPVTREAIVPICTSQPGDDLQPGVHTITCTATNPDNNISSDCQIVITIDDSPICNPPPTPIHGTWSCVDNSCTLICDSGYTPPRSQPTTHYTCGDNGWLPTEPPIITCRETRLPFGMIQSSDAFFTSNANCTGEEKKRRVSEEFNSFLDTLSSSIGEPCSGMCKVQDIVTICQEADPLSRRRRSESTRFFITVCFTLEVDVNGEATEDEINNDRDAITTKTNDIAFGIEEGYFNATVADMIIESRRVDGMPMKSGEVIPLCGAGLTRVPHELFCLPCEQNTYEDGGECHPCPDGQHQPLEGQSSCQLLPDE